MTKFEKFYEEFEALFKKYGYSIAPSMYDDLQIWDKEENEPVTHQDIGLVDCTNGN